jgi:ACS family sodium-dependent inorganic phosphate cotransporter-like MFS transporter 6/7/8
MNIPILLDKQLHNVLLVAGVAGCLWFILWVFFVFDSPAKHPRISAAERHYIEQAIGTKSAIEVCS